MSKQQARLHTIPEALDRLGIGRTTLFGLIKSGAIRSVTIGKRRLVSEAALCEYIERLEA
ncbi:DNA-binding protein [Rhodococcus sp. WS1]|nr:helix-turn-helix domain-containing protein [Rhodococcus sp. WS7]ROZ53831.1 DNA-binding protein [Rhodococcus sp. WS1]TQC36988.1 DNA-binding protein [Rhodococcus sp. WS7]